MRLGTIPDLTYGREDRVCSVEMAMVAQVGEEPTPRWAGPQRLTKLRPRNRWLADPGAPGQLALTDPLLLQKRNEGCRQILHLWFIVVNELDQIFRSVPDVFCWTRFGTEAGERIEEILERKERERRSNDGVFYWGIGNSIAPALAAAIAHRPVIEVLFSPMRGRPRPADANPEEVVVWRSGTTLSGEEHVLPPTVLVTSRGSLTKLRPHYALVCHRQHPLALSDEGSVEVGRLVNLLSGSAVGASQVTAIVKHRATPSRRDPVYPVAFRASLVTPYFVRLQVAADAREQSLAA